MLYQKSLFFSLLLLGYSEVSSHILSAKRSNKRDNLCLIGYHCDEQHNCYKPAVGKRKSSNECAPMNLRNIFGQDDRIAVTNTDYPWKLIGKLSTGCTGTLVGPDIVLTAAHCIIDPDTQELFTKPIEFYPNMINGKYEYSARVVFSWWGTTDPDRVREEDWALLRLDSKLGDELGWLCTKTISFEEMKITEATLVGYSADFQNGMTAGAHINCRIIEQIGPATYLHDCDMTRGASGGPIFAYWGNQACVFLVNVAEYRNGGDISLAVPGFTGKYANIAIWPPTLVKKLNELRNS